MLSNIAAGNCDAAVEPNDLDIEPSTFNHVVVYEDFTGVGNAGADDLTIFVNESRFGHEGSDVSENLSAEGFAAYAEPPLGIGVDVAEAEVHDRARGVRDTLKDVKIVETAFRSSKESGVVRIGRFICLTKALRECGVQKLKV